MDKSRKYRIEHDLIGDMEIPRDAYYGIHTKRASLNFPISGRPVSLKLIYALVIVKKAAAITNKKLGLLDGAIADAIINAADDILTGSYDGEFIVDRMQGGAGTSTNMNVNEVIANIAIEKLNGEKGDYRVVHPLTHVNMSQSTNDVYPTALRLAAIKSLHDLSEQFAVLQEALQRKENEFAGIVKMGRTELQDAVPIMLGQEFGSYAQAVSRDRWRLYKVEERLRQIPLGGSAVGTGINADIRYIYMVTDVLRDLTGIGFARAEYMMDAIQNADVFVEVSGLLKSSAVTLNKIANDLRLMSSGPVCGINEITLPPMQAGSSIMPGKINPIIPEMVNMAAYQVISNDTAITLAAEAGQFELNAMLPLIANNLLDSIDLLTNAVKMFVERCINGIKANADRMNYYVTHSYGQVTALTPYIGYDNASKVVKLCLTQHKTVKSVVLSLKLMSEEEIDKALNPYNMTKPTKVKRRMR